MASTALAERAAGAAAAPGSRRSNIERLEQNRAGIAAALPADTLPAERFIRAMQTEMLRLPELGACTPESLMGAVLECAQLGLEPGPLGHASVLPFKSRKKLPNGQWIEELEAKLIIEYRGFIDLGYRSGMLKSVSLGVVHEGDVWKSYTDETGKHLYHEELRDDTPVVAYFGVFLLSTGGAVIQTLTPLQVESFRKRSASQRKWNESTRKMETSEVPLGAWLSDYDAMAIKTVVRRAENKLPKSAEMIRAFAVDERVIRNPGAALDVPVKADDNVIVAEVYDEAEVVESSPAAGVNGAVRPQGSEGSLYLPEDGPAPAAGSSKASTEELNTLLDLLRNSGIPTNQHNATVGGYIGRNIRGFTNLTSAEVATAVASLDTSAASSPEQQEQGDEVAQPMAPADDDVLLTDSEFERFQIDLEAEGIPLESQGAYVDAVLSRDGGSKLMSRADARAVALAIRAENAAEKASSAS